MRKGWNATSVVYFLGLLVVRLALLTGDVRAQAEPKPVHVEWMVGEAPEGGWTVGDRIPLRLRATHSPDLEVTLPELPAQWGAFEVFDQTMLEDLNEDGTVSTVGEATVTLWAPGNHRTPPLTVRYQDAGDQLRELSVPPLTITVASVLSEGETEKRDLKAQVSLDRPPVWPWALGGLLLAALAGVTGWLLLTRWRRRAAPAFAPALPRDTRPPEEIAYGELSRIAALNLPAQGEVKRHYTLVADCMRAYVEGRYRLTALDRTTEELAVAFRQVRVDRDHAALFRDLLFEADLVKFARAGPTLRQAHEIVDQAKHIVDVTKTSQLVDEQIDASTVPDAKSESQIPAE